MFRKNKEMRTWTKKIAFLLFIIIGVTAGAVLARDTVVDPGYNPGLVDPNISGITGNAWATISMVVMVFALGCIVVTGLRYMLASSDRKADIKQSSAYIIIGCVFIFAAMPIINIVTKTGGEIIGTDVTYDGSKDFKGDKDIVSVTIKDDVDKQDFQNCTNLRTVIFEEGVTNIQSKAFMGCTSLEEIILPSTIKSVGESAFEGCKSAKRIAIRGKSAPDSTLNGGITYYAPGVIIGPKAFKGCSQAANFGIGSNIYIGTIDKNAFENCKKLTGFYPCSADGKTTNTASNADIAFSYLNVAGSAEASIGENAFKNTAIQSLNLKTVNSYGTITNASGWAEIKYLPTKLIINSSVISGADDKNYLKGITISSGSNIVFGNSSFKGIASLNSIIVSDNVNVNFGTESFAECLTLNNISLGTNVTPKFGVKSFSGSGNAKSSVIIGDGGSKITIDKQAFYDSAFEKFEIGKNHDVYIGDSAFQNSSIEQFIIPLKMTILGATASPIEYSVISYLGEYSFSGCKSLEQFGTNNAANYVYMNFTDGAKAIIGAYAFDGCLNLKSFCIYAPDKVVEVATGAFRDCAKFSGLNFASYAKIGNIGDSAFKGSGFKGALDVYGTKIGASAFEGTQQLSINMKTASTSLFIGEKAFKDSRITKFTHSGGILDISANAFRNCDGLTQLKITFKNIGESAFNDCNGLKSATLIAASYSEWATIMPEAFKKSFASNAELNFEGKINVGQAAFSESNVQNVNFLGTYMLGNKAFSFSPNLAQVRLAPLTQILSIGDYAFDYCNKLTLITAPGASANTAIGEIGKYAFHVNTTLEGASDVALSIKGGITFKKINSNAFGGRRIGVLEIVPNLEEGCTISEKAFYDSNYKNSTGEGLIVLGKGIFKLEPKAFEQANIKYIVLTNSGTGTVFTSIPGKAFLNSGLQGFVNSNKDYTSFSQAYIKCDKIEAGAFEGANKIKTLYMQPTSLGATLVVGSTETELGLNASSHKLTLFGNFNKKEDAAKVNLQTVKFKGNVVVGVSAFAYIGSLKSVGFEVFTTSAETKVTINDNAFYSCSYLSRVGIGTSAAYKLQFLEFGKNSFIGCGYDEEQEFKFVKIEDGVFTDSVLPIYMGSNSRIESQAFYNVKMNSIHLKASRAQTSVKIQGAFGGNTELKKLILDAHAGTGYFEKPTFIIGGVSGETAVYTPNDLTIDIKNNVYVKFLSNSVEGRNDRELSIVYSGPESNMSYVTGLDEVNPVASFRKWGDVYRKKYDEDKEELYGLWN